MKRILALLMVCIFAAAALSACSIFPRIPAQRPTEPLNTAPSAAAVTEAPEQQAATEAVETQAPTEASVETLDSYVRTAKKASYTFSDGNTKTFRIPEILLDSSDAAAANSEIMDRFGDDVQEYTEYCPVVSLDYEAYLNDVYLSVIVTGTFEGGNSYGLCYTFSVTSGSELNSATLCSAIGCDYNEALSDLTDNLTEDYDQKFGSIPGNDTERGKTLDSENIKAAKMYLDGSGNLMAMVDFYAAVGGGHWVYSVSAE